MTNAAYTTMNTNTAWQRMNTWLAVAACLGVGNAFAQDSSAAQPAASQQTRAATDAPDQGSLGSARSQNPALVPGTPRDGFVNPQDRPPEPGPTLEDTCRDEDFNCRPTEQRDEPRKSVSPAEINVRPDAGENADRPDADGYNNGRETDGVNRGRDVDAPNDYNDSRGIVEAD